jgi:uncharacterized membrane protein YukC
MASELARWAFVGMIIGTILFSILFGYYYFTATRMTDDEKSEINNAYAVNCTKCLVKENVSCTVETLEYTSWGTICNTDYIPRNCTQCKRI